MHTTVLSPRNKNRPLWAAAAPGMWGGRQEGRRVFVQVKPGRALPPLPKGGDSFGRVAQMLA